MPTKTAQRIVEAPDGSPGPGALRPKESFQDLILTLQRFWGEQGCVILQPYDMEVGAGTFHPATTLQPSGRHLECRLRTALAAAKDGRYGENPNRMQHYYQFQVIMKPSPPDILDLYLKSLDAIGIDTTLNDIRFVEQLGKPDARRVGPRLGSLVQRHGGDAIHLLPAGRRLDCRPVSGEITYGLERLAMYVQGVDRVWDFNFNGRHDERKLHLQRRLPAGRAAILALQLQHADTRGAARHFSDAEAECKSLIEKGWSEPQQARTRHLMVLPAYDQCIKASHIFQPARRPRGVISVTERQSYILRVRELCKACCGAWLATEGGGG